MSNMPSIDLSHKACGVSNFMSCAFNVMYVYSNSKHASSDKTAPRQQINNKKHVKSKNVHSKHLNNVKHAKTKTAGPPKVKVDTFVPNPKQKVVKVVY